MNCRGKRRHTLSARLVVLFLMMGVLFVLLVGGSMGFAFRTNLQESLIPHLVRYAEYIQADIGMPPDLAKASEIAAKLPVEIHIIGPGIRWASTGSPIDRHNLKIHKRFMTKESEYAFAHDARRPYLVNLQGDTFFAFSVPSLDQGWRWHKAAPVVLLLVVLMVLYHATRRLFSPIKTLRAGIERIGGGDLEHRIRIDRRDELGDLARSINAMADHIQQLLEAKRQLLLAISHELRSPLTRAKVATELMDKEELKAEIHRDLDEMERLLADLLESERLSGGHRLLNRSDLSVGALIDEVVEGCFRGKLLTVERPGAEIHANLDGARLKLLLRNLLENALRHTPPDGEPPQLILDRDEESLRVSVRDFGEGIEPRHIPHLAEPFYRVDSARQRETGGYGLGLYLCRVIAEAHGGRLAIRSRPGEGTEVTVTLPVAARTE